MAENHTFAGYPDPRVDDAADGGPLRGWTQTSGYNAVANLGSGPTDNVALLCYDRQGWGGGESVFTSHTMLARSSVLAVSQLITIAKVRAGACKDRHNHFRIRIAGYYGVGLPPIFGPKGAWPNGRAAPQGCYLDVSTTHCVRVKVVLT